MTASILKNLYQMHMHLMISRPRLSPMLQQHPHHWQVLHSTSCQLQRLEALHALNYAINDTLCHHSCWHGLGKQGRYPNDWQPQHILVYLCTDLLADMLMS